MEVVVVLVTVRRGWSGGTGGRGEAKHKQTKLSLTRHLLTTEPKQRDPGPGLTLDLQVQDDLVRPKAVTGHAGVVPRILGFHRADDQAAVAVDTASAVNHDRCWGSVAGR